MARRHLEPESGVVDVTVMFQARDSSSNAQPITTSPVATLNPKYPAVLGTMVYFVTGELLGTPDLASTQVQTIYGVYDPVAGYSSPLLRTNAAMEPEPLSYASSNAAAIIVTGNALTIPTQEGWYIDLNLPACGGMRAGPGFAYRRTRRHRSPHRERRRAGADDLSAEPNVCTAGGNSFLYVLDYAGGSFTSPQFDINKGGKINSADTVTNGTGSHGLSGRHGTRQRLRGRPHDSYRQYDIQREPSSSSPDPTARFRPSSRKAIPRAVLHGGRFTNEESDW